MHLTSETAHDEINLFRLVRRLEKSVQVNEVWDVPENDEDEDAVKWRKEEVYLRSQKELQKVKHARKLVRNVEGSSESSEHIRRINGVKITLDKIEAFLKATEAKYTPAPPNPPSLLDQLPIPQDLRTDSEAGEGAGGDTTPKGPPPLDLPAGDNFLLTPSDLQGLPSSGLVSALPALMSAEPLTPDPFTPAPSFAPSSSFTSLAPRSSTTTTTALDTTPTLQHRANTTSDIAHTALQNELSTQLEHMAAQLKRNALHFASSLEKDKSVVEDAQGKIEGNLSFMEVQRARLRGFAGRSGGTTWMTMGVVLFVMLVFMVMVGVIRLARI